MKDPTRIPRVLDALREVWEGQPDLELAALWGVISNHGVGWGTDDEELLGALRDLSATYPASLADASFPGRLALIDTQSPQRRVSIDGDTLRVVVRARGGEVVPATWEAAALKLAAASAPLVLTDAEGIDHRLGVVERIHVVDKPGLSTLTSRRSGFPESSTWGVLLAREEGPGQDLALVGHTVRVYRAGRRAVENENHRFDRILSCAPGEQLRIQQGARTSVRDLGLVTAVFPVEV